MKSATITHQTSSEIIRLCHSSLDSHTLRLKILKQLQNVVTFDYIFFATTDPTTMFHTSSVIDPTPDWVMLQFMENELVQNDFNKFRFLVESRRSVGVLSEQTQHKLQRSQRYRNILEPMTLGDEMRAVFVTNGACWGTLCLHRERAITNYTSVEADFLARLTPHIAEGLRKSLLLQHAPGSATLNDPGVLILAEDLSIVMMDSVATHWMAELTDLGRGDRQALPQTVMGVIKNLQMLEKVSPDTLSPQPKQRVFTPSGHWLMLYASWLNNAAGQRQIAVIFKTAQPAEIAPLIILAYQFTKREGEVTGLILRGLPTAAISAALHISTNTVQDHLKAIFEKVDVRSRKELVAKIFAQQYQQYLTVGVPAPVNASGQLSLE